MALWNHQEQQRVSRSPHHPHAAGQAPDHGPGYVSIVNELPEDLYDAMREFVRTHPQWDQYRLIQASLAGFLFQHGSTDRAVSRHYLDGLFRREGISARPQAPTPSADPRPAPSITRTLTPNPQPPQDRSWPAAA